MYFKLFIIVVSVTPVLCLAHYINVCAIMRSPTNSQHWLISASKYTDIRLTQNRTRMSHLSSSPPSAGQAIIFVIQYIPSCAESSSLFDRPLFLLSETSSLTDFAQMLVFPLRTVAKPFRSSLFKENVYEFMCASFPMLSFPIRSDLDFFLPT